jgi:hypothetical protein
MKAVQNQQSGKQQAAIQKLQRAQEIETVAINIYIQKVARDDSADGDPDVYRVHFDQSMEAAEVYAEQKAIWKAKFLSEDNN